MDAETNRNIALRLYSHAILDFYRRGQLFDSHGNILPDYPLDTALQIALNSGATDEELSEIEQPSLALALELYDEAIQIFYDRGLFFAEGIIVEDPHLEKMLDLALAFGATEEQLVAIESRY